MAEPTVQHLVNEIVRQRDEALAAAASARAALTAALEEIQKLKLTGEHGAGGDEE